MDDFRAMLDASLAETPWVIHGACAEPGLQARWFDENGDETELGVAVCRRCPVSGECFEFAIDRGRAGVWGGQVIGRIVGPRR